MAGSQKKFYGALAVIALAGLGLIGYALVQGQPGSTVETAAVEPSGDTGAPVGMDVGVSRGSPDAPVTLEEYLDYQCPYCAMVSRLTIPGIIQRYVDTGKVRYIIFDFPVHQGDKSYVAAEAAHCAGDQDAFWPMHEALFGHMSEWEPKSNPTGEFKDYAKQLGLDTDAFEKCLDSRKYLKRVQASRLRGDQHAVNATPTFIIDGKERVSGAIGFDRLAKMLDDELAKANATVGQ